MRSWNTRAHSCCQRAAICSDIVRLLRSAWNMDCEGKGGGHSGGAVCSMSA